MVYLNHPFFFPLERYYTWFLVYLIKIYFVIICIGINEYFANIKWRTGCGHTCSKQG